MWFSFLGLVEFYSGLLMAWVNFLPFVLYFACFYILFDTSCRRIGFVDL